MRAALRILSVLTLVTLAVAIVAQALTYTQGIIYDPLGLPVDATPLNLAVTYGSAGGTILGMPLTIATLILGLIVISGDHRTGWIVALATVGTLALAGIFVMAWVLLSTTTPFAFQTPLVGIPLVTLLYSLITPAHHDAPAATAS